MTDLNRTNGRHTFYTPLSEMRPKEARFYTLKLSKTC